MTVFWQTARSARLLAGLVLLIVAVVFTHAQGRAEDPTAEARKFIEDLAASAIAALTPTDISRSEREARSRSLLQENFAVETIGRFVLGRYWQQATPEQREEYLRLIEDLIVTTYVDRFARYTGETLTVTRAVAAEEGGDVIVFSQINRPGGGDPVNVGWRVRAQGGGHKIVDVLVEGVSMGRTQRDEFSSVIRNGGGTVEPLLAEMRRRVKTDT